MQFIDICMQQIVQVNAVKSAVIKLHVIFKFVEHKF